MDAGPRHRETGVRRRQSAPHRIDAQDRNLDPRIFICRVECSGEGGLEIDHGRFRASCRSGGSGEHTDQLPILIRHYH